MIFHLRHSANDSEIDDAFYDTELPIAKKKGRQIVDDYSEIELTGNSKEQVKDIIELIKKISEDITIQFIQPNNSDDCIRGKVNGNKTIIDVYGHSKGYAISLSAPDEMVLRNAIEYPEIKQLICQTYSYAMLLSVMYILL